MGSQMPDETGCRFAVGQQQMLPQGVQAVNHDILLAKLRPGQIIDLEAHCIKGTWAQTYLAALDTAQQPYSQLLMWLCPMHPIHVSGTFTCSFCEVCILRDKVTLQGRARSMPSGLLWPLPGTSSCQRLSLPRCNPAHLSTCGLLYQISSPRSML